MYGALVGAALVAVIYGIWVASAAIWRRIAGKATTGKAFAGVVGGLVGMPLIGFALVLTANSIDPRPSADQAATAGAATIDADPEPESATNHAASPEPERELAWYEARTDLEFRDPMIP